MDQTIHEHIIDIRKFLALPGLTLKAAENGDAELEAILSEVGVVDSDGDKILPGAFDAAIAAGQTPDMLYMHRRGYIVGQWSGLRMDGTKFRASGQLYNGDGGFDLARQAYRLAKTGQLAGVSIGFRLKRWITVAGDESRPYGWDIVELELIEASLVDRPANESAQLTEIKRKFAGEAGADQADRQLADIQKILSGY